MLFKKLITSKQFYQHIVLIVTTFLLLPFIIFFSATGRSPVKGPGGSAGVVFGQPIPWEDFQAQKAWLLRQWKAQFGEALERMTPMIIQSTWDRLILLEEAKRQHMRVDDRELATFIQQIPGLQTNGRFSPERYRQYVASVRMRPEQFEQLLRSDLAIEKLVNRIKTSVTITDDEVREAYIKDHERLKALVIFFDAGAFHDTATTTVTDEAIRAYYEAHPDDFRIPEQIMIESAGASYDELTAAVRLDDEAIKTFYDVHSDLFAKDDGSPKPFEEAKDRVRQEAIHERVRKQLTSLALDLEDDLKAKRSFDEIVKARALIVHSAGPLSPGDLWVTNGPEPAVLEAVAKLAVGEVSGVIETEHGVSIARVTKRIPSRLPPLEETRITIRNQLIATTAKKIAHDRAVTLHEYFKTKREVGVRFEEAALAYGSAIPVSPATFGRTEAIEPIGTIPKVNEAAFKTSLGSVTDVIETTHGFVIVRPEERLPADMADFPKIAETLRKNTLDHKQSLQVSRWLTEIRSKANLKTFVDASPSTS